MYCTAKTEAANLPTNSNAAQRSDPTGCPVLHVIDLTALANLHYTCLESAHYIIIHLMAGHCCQNLCKFCYFTTPMVCIWLPRTCILHATIHDHDRHAPGIDSPHSNYQHMMAITLGGALNLRLTDWYLPTCIYQRRKISAWKGPLQPTTGNLATYTSPLFSLTHRIPILRVLNIAG